MLSVEDNEVLTRTGRGTPMGELFRRFWIPALLSSELPQQGGPAVKVGLLGEKLIAFRGKDGKLRASSRRSRSGPTRSASAPSPVTAPPGRPGTNSSTPRNTNDRN
ncbi:hypothetical protein LRP67_09345 [Nocardioides sp. cx-169]|uniref:hypothetical protein n=1 Tax=Nocardioides sp. cx-169 TaxID=2899080 RepID=UPI001E383298|nr:hypothetical protein [Nocardioides sp. cx-169]MCD4534284.1 hypothetical protein [Nocardioides sp. cx-169]